MKISNSMRERATGIARALRRYGNHIRKFPWRRNRDPYRLAVAELLLQKTRASSAVPVYAQMLTRYPSPQSLARSNEKSIELLLRPLGLSRKRARHFIGLGRALAELGTDILSSHASAMTLPGLGSYGSRAVSCFAFGAHVGIVDANVRRILTRVFGLRKMDPRSPRYQAIADRIIGEARDPAAANYALLDIGALICAREPRCEVCPLAKSCKFAATR